MELKALFEVAVANSRNIPQKPANETLLQLYALYKQATEGDIHTAPPSNPFDFVNKAKHDAWSALKGTTSETAMTGYITLVEKLQD